MPHNSLIHGGPGSGAWPGGYVLTALDFQKLDQAQFESINGDQGGAWAPATPITIGGSGLQVTAPFGVTGDSTFNGRIAVADRTDFTGAFVYIAGDAQVGGDFVLTGPGTFQVDSGVVSANFYSSISVGDGTNAQTTSFNAHSDITFQPGSWVHANGKFDFSDGVHAAAVTFQSTADVDFLAGSICTFGGTTRFVAPFTVEDKLTFTGTGRPVYHRIVGVDADHDYSAGDAQIITIPLVSASRVYKLLKAGAVDGDVIELIATSSTHDVSIQLEGGTTLADMMVASTFDTYLKVVFSATVNDWALVTKATKP